MMEKNIVRVQHRGQSLGKNEGTSSSAKVVRRESANRKVTGSQLNTSIVSSPCKQQHSAKLTYYIGKGNNEGIVRTVLQRRANWTETENSTSAFINLKWQSDQKGIRYERLVSSSLYRNSANHFQFHSNLSNKQFLFRNLEQHCEKIGTNLWSIVPPTFVLDVSDNCCQQNLNLFIDFYIKHYPSSSNPKNNVRAVDKEIRIEKKRLQQYFCQSNFKKRFDILPAMKPCFLNRSQGDYLWIAKPTFLNRGRGIHIFSKLSDLTQFVRENINGYMEKKPWESDAQKKLPLVDYVRRNWEMAREAVHYREAQLQRLKEYRQKLKKQLANEATVNGNEFIRLNPSNVSSNIRTNRFIVQKYLQNPMLIHNRKFDVRIWVLVSHNMKGYVFAEGYARLSSFEYSCKEGYDKQFVHLTNNAVQKHSSDYGKLYDANQMSFSDLSKQMSAQGLSFQTFKQQTYSHITASLNSCIRKLNLNNRKHTFQIFGYDFMIDCDGYPWLIEVNTNPCIEESSQLLRKLIPRMLDDAFKLTIDCMFYGSYSSGEFPVEGYDKVNMWELLPVDPV